LAHSFLSRIGDEPSLPDEALDGRSALADLNGDGRPDIITRVKYHNPLPPVIDRRAKLSSLNSGNGFEAPTGSVCQLPDPLGECDESSMLIRYMVTNYDPLWEKIEIKRSGAREFDVNGDGLDDHFVASSGDDEIYLNNGHGYAEDDASDPWDFPNEEIYFDDNEAFLHSADVGTRIVDLNGDGRLDVVRYQQVSPMHLLFNNGNPAGRAEDGPWIEPASTTPWAVERFVDAYGRDNGIRFADMNGDGMVDMIRMVPGNRYIRLNKGEVPDLLISVTNHFGGTTSITYRAEMVPGMGVLQVVDSIETDAGTADPAQMSKYSYEDPEYEPAEREFRGFGVVTATRAMPLPQDERVVVTVYKQGAADFGLPESVAVSDPVLGEVRRTEFAYTEDTDGPPFVSLLASKRVSEFGENLWRETLTEFVYGDLYGNLEALIEHGDVCAGCTGDDRRWDFHYTVDDDSYLVDRVNRRLLCPGVGACGEQNRVRETHLYYDGHNDNLEAEPLKGNLTKRVEVLEAGAGPTTTYGYDAYGNVTQVTNPRRNAGEPLSGSPVVIEYEDGGYYAFPTSITNAAEHETRLAYTDLGGVCSVDYPAGAGLVQYEQGPNDYPAQTGWVRCYDAFGRPTRERAPNDLAETTWTYDDVLHKVSERRRATESGTLRETTTSFDGLGRVIATQSSGASGDVYANRSYDGAGRLETQTDPHYLSDTVRTTRYAYDVLDRVTRVYLPGRRPAEVPEQVIEYDAGTVTFTDANHFVRVEKVDPWGNVVEVDEPEVENNIPITRYVYDVANLLTKITDPGGNVTEIFYDKLGRREDLYDPDAGHYSYGYDSNGNLRDLEGPNGTVHWTYEALDRPKTRDPGNVVWSYDADPNGKGLLAMRTEEAVTRTYNPIQYDLLGRIRDENRKAGDQTHNFKTTYDPLGQIESRTYPGGQEVDWIRDDAGFLLEIRGYVGETEYAYATEIDWDAQERLESWTDGDGLTSTNTFEDSTGRIRNVNVGDFESLEYTFDPGDRLVGIIDWVRGGARSFQYDQVNRLIDARGPFRSGVSDVLLYDYDDLGNVTCLGASNLTNCQEGTAFTYRSPSPGQGVVQPHAPLQINNQNVTHDGAGNLTGRGVYTYHYNVLGEMASVEENTTTVASMSYDATGGLAKMVEGGEERYLIAEDFEWLKTSQLRRVQIPLAGTVIASHQASYNPGSGGPGICVALLPVVDGDWRAPLGLFAPGLCAFVLLQVGFALRRRPRGARLRVVLAAGTGGVFLVATSVPLPGLVSEARADAPGVTYYHGDYLGSSLVITNGTDVQQVLYRPFGEAAPSSSQVPEYGFTGQRYVSSIGIYDYGARWYDPELGRFLSPDSVVPTVYDPQSVNPYSYVRNNPLNRIDPTGNFDWGGLWGGFTGFFSNIFAPIGNAFTSAGGSFDSFMDSVGNGFQIDSLSFGFGGGGLPQVQVQFGPGAQAATSSAPSQGSLRSDVQGYAQVQSNLVRRGAIDDAYATGMIFEYALERSGPEGALNNVSAVLSDVAGRFGRDPGNWYLGYQAFGQSGFRSAFGETPSGNQVRHFTAHVLLGYYWGNGAAARSFVAWREGGFRGPDYASGVAGLNLGVGLRSGAVTGSNIFDVVQDYLR
jgi:RHS repeat-associated protein